MLNQRNARSLSKLRAKWSDTTGKYDFKGMLLGLVIMVVLWAIVAAGIKWFHAHDAFLTAGETLPLNEYIADGQSFPMKEYVRLDVRYPLGSFAINTSQITIGGSDRGFETGKAYYDLRMLEDYSFMALQLSSQKDIDTLKRYEDTLDFSSSDALRRSGENISYTVSGKLVPLTDKDIKLRYDVALSRMGVNSAEYNIRYVCLDATAIRAKNVLLYIVLPLAVIVAIYIVSKKRKQAQAQQ